MEGEGLPTSSEEDLVSIFEDFVKGGGVLELGDLSAGNATVTASSGAQEMFDQEQPELHVGNGTATTSLGARPPCLPLDHGVPPRQARVPRSHGGRIKRFGVSYQKDTILRNQRLNRLRSSNLEGGKIDSVAAGSKEIGTTAVSCGKRPRSKNWSPEEKSCFLELKEEAVRVCDGKPWESISRYLKERHRIERSAKCCEDLWGTMRKQYFAIRMHESATNDHHASKLSQGFHVGWYETMERILAAQKKKRSKAKEKHPGKKSREMAVQESLGDGDDNECCKNRQPQLGQGPRALDRDEMLHLEYVGSGGPSSILEEPLGKEHAEDASNDAFDDAVDDRVKGVVEDAVDDRVKGVVEDAVDSVFQRLGTTTDLMTRLSPVIKHMTQHAITEDDLMSMIAPFMKEHIEGALELELRPLASDLQAIARLRAIEEKKRALEEEKRALDCEEEQIKRQHVGRQRRRSLRTNSFRRQGRSPLQRGPVIPA